MTEHHVHGARSCAPVPGSTAALAAERTLDSGRLKVLVISRPTDNVRWTGGHPVAGSVPLLCKTLLEANFDIELVNNFDRVRRDPSDMPGEGLAWFDAVVFHGKLEWHDDQALSMLKRFVEGGKGLVVVHIASASFAPAGAPSASQDWKNLAGSVFGYAPPGHPPNTPSPFSGHPPLAPIRVRLDRPDHPILAGIPLNFELDLDELYQRMEPGADGPGERIASGTTPDGQGGTADEPIAFVLERGAGRVFNLYPGHSIETHRDWRFQQILTQGIEWAARRR